MENIKTRDRARNDMIRKEKEETPIRYNANLELLGRRWASIDYRDGLRSQIDKLNKLYAKKKIGEWEWEDRVYDLQVEIKRSREEFDKMTLMNY